MTLEVFTARIGTKDPDVLDITRGSGKGLGLTFAPSKDLLAPAIAARRAAEKKREKAADLAAAGGIGTAQMLERQADDMENAAWAVYEPRYMAEMRVSYGLAPEKHGPLERLAIERNVKPNRKAWAELLGRKRVVLICYCTDPERCHRRLLAGILGKLGAVDRGEIGAPAPSPSPAPGTTERDLKPENITEARAELAELTASTLALVEQLADSGAYGPSTWRPRG